MIIDHDGIEGYVDGVGSRSVGSAALPTTAVSSFRRMDEENLKFYLGDYGQVLHIYVGDKLELGRAADYIFKVRKPDGELVIWRPDLCLDDGYLRHRILMGNLDQVGKWSLQAWVDLDEWVGLGETVEFEVFELWM